MSDRIDPSLAAGGNGEAPGEPAKRVTVRNPRGRATRPTAPGERALAELKEQTEVGEVLLRSLTRAQLMLAVRIFAVFGFFLLGLPALFATHPGLADSRILGLPLPWLVLGGATVGATGATAPSQVYVAEVWATMSEPLAPFRA